MPRFATRCNQKWLCIHRGAVRPDSDERGNDSGDCTSFMEQLPERSLRCGLEVNEPRRWRVRRCASRSAESLRSEVYCFASRNLYGHTASILATVDATPER